MSKFRHRQDGDHPSTRRVWELGSPEKFLEDIKSEHADSTKPKGLERVFPSHTLPWQENKDFLSPMTENRPPYPGPDPDRVVVDSDSTNKTTDWDSIKAAMKDIPSVTEWIKEQQSLQVYRLMDGKPVLDEKWTNFTKLVGSKLTGTFVIDPTKSFKNIAFIGIIGEYKEFVRYSLPDELRDNVVHITHEERLRGVEWDLVIVGGSAYNMTGYACYREIIRVALTRCKQIIYL